MSRQASTFSTIVFLLLVSPSAYACSCAISDPPSEFNSAKAIFIGRMLGGTEKLSARDTNGKTYAIEAGTVRFEIEESFKGDLVGQVPIEIASMIGTSCGPYGLKRSVRYLVYAYAGREQNLYSGVCTRTAPVDEGSVKEDLKFLRNLPPPGTGGNLKGSIWADLRGGGATPLSNLKVSIRGPDDKELTAFTGEHGDFEVKLLKPGTYRVTPELPDNYISTQKFQEVVVNDRGTAHVAFEAYINGSLQGRVVDKDGNAFNGVFLHLKSADRSTYGHSTGENGFFKAEGIPPGEYYLFIEMQNRDYKKNENFYYPGTLNREEATVVKVGLGEKIEGLEFVLPDKYLIRMIEGQVTWKDGTPAAKVEVMLLCPRGADPDGFAMEFMPPTTTTDDQGHFTLQAFTRETYWIEARGSQDKNIDSVKAFHSSSKRLDVTDNLKFINLVLSQKGYFGEGCEK